MGNFLIYFLFIFQLYAKKILSAIKYWRIYLLSVGNKNLNHIEVN